MSFARRFRYDERMKIQTHVNLAAHHTFAVAATATHFCQVNSREDLLACLAQPQTRDLPQLILGEGSNVLFTQHYPGLVIQNRISGYECIDETNDAVWLRIGAGEPWHSLVCHCIEQGWYGIENLSLIPGTVGAAPMQNIGAYGVELESVFHSLNAMNLTTGEMKTFHHRDCHFGYRDSVFKQHLANRFCITDVTLRLSKQPHFTLHYPALKTHLDQFNITPTLRSISEAIIALRQSKLPNPRVLPNAGSFFKNPIVRQQQYQQLQQQFPDLPHFPINDTHTKLPAAWLIEHCGYKGKREGNVGTHTQQALVLVNHGNATGQSIHAFATQIQQSVQNHFGILLQREVNCFP